MLGYRRGFPGLLGALLVLGFLFVILVVVHHVVVALCLNLHVHAVVVVVVALLSLDILALLALSSALLLSSLCLLCLLLLEFAHVDILDFVAGILALPLALLVVLWCLRDRLAGLLGNGDYLIVGSIVKILVDFTKLGVWILAFRVALGLWTNLLARGRCRLRTLVSCSCAVTM